MGLDLQEVQMLGFRVCIPVLLPEASAGAIPQFLSTKPGLTFVEAKTMDAFHVLVQGIRGEPIRRRPRGAQLGVTHTLAEYERKLRELQRLKVWVHGE